MTLFADLVEATGREGAEGEVGVEVTSCRNLFRADTPHAPQAEPLLTGAIAEGWNKFGEKLLLISDLLQELKLNN